MEKPPFTFSFHTHTSNIFISPVSNSFKFHHQIPFHRLSFTSTSRSQSSPIQTTISQHGKKFISLGSSPTQPTDHFKLQSHRGARPGGPLHLLPVFQTFKPSQSNHIPQKTFSNLKAHFQQIKFKHTFNQFTPFQFNASKCFQIQPNLISNIFHKFPTLHTPTHLTQQFITFHLNFHSSPTTAIHTKFHSKFRFTNTPHSLPLSSSTFPLHSISHFKTFIFPFNQFTKSSFSFIHSTLSVSQSSTFTTSKFISRKIQSTLPTTHTTPHFSPVNPQPSSSSSHHHHHFNQQSSPSSKHHFHPPSTPFQFKFPPPPQPNSNARSHSTSFSNRTPIQSHKPLTFNQQFLHSFQTSTHFQFPNSSHSQSFTLSNQTVFIIHSPNFLQFNIHTRAGG